mmetsp:Transcript_23049/g.36035  ORF Transcript_23049/g.36035 Transcript_23049/m.36035 type:complete len:490 (+) Transcript_23049:40-1509(+)
MLLPVIVLRFLVLPLPNNLIAMQDHVGPVSDAAIGRALGNLSYCDDEAKSERNNSKGPHYQSDLELVTKVSNRPLENDNLDEIAEEGAGSNELASYDPAPQSSSSSEWGGQKIHKEKLRMLPPAITNAYDNWSCDNENVSTANHTIRNNPNDSGDEIAWKIIKGILSGWCVIWILFAVIIVVAELTSPKTPRSNIYTLMMTEKDEQSFLEISENVVSKCAYSKLETETGREECQLSCRQHMCCFNDEDNFGCSENPEKMCAAYAGCESLIVSEDDAIIYDADGVDVFGIGDANSDSQASDEGDEQQQSQNVTETYATSELQLISEVITTVCSTDSLGTKHGLNECASLCNDGMCCFDREQIEFLNPNVDLILELEGITSDRLDTSTMGTCMEGGNHKEHFCQVHASCKKLLLLGSHYSGTDLNDGVGDNASGGNYIVFTILFAMIALLTVYMLVFQRAHPVHVDVSRIPRVINAAREGTSTRDERVVFV